MNKSSLNLEAKMIVKKYTSVTENENNIMRLIADIVLLAIRMFKIFMEILNIDDIIDDEEDFKILQSNQMKSATATTKSSMMKEDLKQLKCAEKSCKVIKKKVHFQFPLKDSTLKIMKQHISSTTSKSVPSIRIIEKQDKSTQTTEMPKETSQRSSQAAEKLRKSNLTAKMSERPTQVFEMPKRSTQTIETLQRPTQVFEMPKRSTQTIETPQRSIQMAKTSHRPTQLAETPQGSSLFAETPQRSSEFAKTPQRSTATPPSSTHFAAIPPRSIHSAVTPQRSTQITENPQRSENSNILTCSNTKYSCRKYEETKPKVNYPEPTKKVELYRVELLHHLLTMQHLKQKPKAEQRFGSTRRRLEF